MSFCDTVTTNVKKSTGLLATAVALPLFLGFSAAAMATNGILPIGNGMTAHGLGGAGIANPGDAMAGADNPALVAETGDQMAAGLTLFAPYRSADIGVLNPSGYVDSDKTLFPIPAFGWTKSLNSKANMGVLVTAMGGMNTTYPAKLNGTDGFGVDLSGLIIAPTLSYKNSDKLETGVSLLLGYEKLTTKLPAGYDSGTDSAVGTGVKLGLAYQAFDNTKLGAFYQSRIRMGEMDKHCTGAGAFSGAKQFGIACDVSMAPITGVGMKLDTSSNSKIVMDLMHVAWSKVELFQKAFGWSDQEVLKIGVEIQQSSTFAWRIGYNYAAQPVNPNSIVVAQNLADPNTYQMPGVMAPAVTEFHYTFGFTMKMGKNELVGYYAYVPEIEVADPAQPVPGMDAGAGSGAKVKMYQHALGIGFNWK